MRHRMLLAAACLLATSLTACKTVLPKPKPDTEVEAASDPEWREILRSLNGTGTTTGMSPEAREIEKSLGSR